MLDVVLTQNQTHIKEPLDLKQEIEKFVTQPNYPCVAAVHSFLKGDYILKSYEGFGKGLNAKRLREDLLDFKKEQRQKKSPYFSFWAVFPNSHFANEEDFETALWSELSYLVAADSECTSWDPKFSKNPEDKNFCFSLGGDAFFVVGMFPQSSRKGRQFPYTAVAFNLYEQFQTLMDEFKFEPMVRANRKRELQFQGNLNPMVVQHGQDWESIQFSGKENPQGWKCPFKHLFSLLSK